MPSHSHAHHFRSAALSALACLSSAPANAFEMTTIENPIGRIARIFNGSGFFSVKTLKWIGAG
jgi:hypothetical protein